MSAASPEPIIREPAASEPRVTLRPLSFRGRIFKGLALTPEPPVGDWLAGLDHALKRSPTLLQGRALILDVAELKPSLDDLQGLLAELRSRDIRVLGIEGTEAAGEGLPAEPEPLVVTSITVEGSIRSGQSIVNPTGDVTVMGHVSSGAEVLAGGSIHVYGALRGRAIAGAARNPRARIYCRKFEPELLGIDRLVRTAEDMGSALRGKAAQVWLDGGTMKLAKLD